METMPVTTTNYVCLENGECHILILNHIGNGKAMSRSQNLTPKSAGFATPLEYSTRISPELEQFCRKK